MDNLELLLAYARKEQEELDWHIKWLEGLIAQIQATESVNLNQQTHVRRPYKRTAPRRKHASVPIMAETILRAHPTGLMVPQLIAELRNLGYESRSKNPANTLNSILRGSPKFKRLPDGRWTLVEFVKANNSNGTKEETPIH